MTREITEVIVQTLGQLLDRATPTIPDLASGRLRDCAVYRGLSDSTWSLLTSLDRLGGISPPHSKAHLEEHILRNFIRYSRPHMEQGQISTLELLIAAQHHGLPTRLLDWTYSPLVAAHFATVEPNRSTDRVVWKLDWVRVHEHFGLQPLAFLESDFKNLLHKRGLESIWDLFQLDDTFDKPLVCMLEPPSLNPRIISQSATFTISSTKTQPLEALLRANDLTSTLTRFIIPVSRVNRVRDQLDLCSVDERRLFPDLDGVSAEMRRYYSTSPSSDSRIR